LGSWGYGINFADYEAALLSNSLHPSNGVLLNHSEVDINAAANPNVASKGMYDFILTYYNPDADYDSAAYEIKDQNNRLAYADGRAHLPSWPSGLIFDGRHVPGSSNFATRLGIIILVNRFAKTPGYRPHPFAGFLHLLGGFTKKRKKTQKN
jgi:hypothetical protein